MACSLVVTNRWFVTCRGRLRADSQRLITTPEAGSRDVAPRCRDLQKDYT